MPNITDPRTIEVLRKGMSFNPFFTDGKKLQPSFIWMGKKNAGKTWTLLNTFRGPMLILSFDNQTEIIVSERIRLEKKQFGESFIEKNVVVANFFPSEYRHIKGNGDERRLDVGYAIIRDVEKMLDNIRSHNMHFDYIVVDGYPDLKNRISEYMRKCARLTYEEPILGEDLKAYGYRNRFFQVLTSSMFELSDICPIFTTYPKVDLSKAFKGTPPPEPEMDKEFMTSFRNVIWIERTDEEGKNKRATRQFYAKLQSVKGIDFGEEGTVINVTGNVPVFPLEKLESYRKGNPLNHVETPRIQIASESDMDLDDSIPEKEKEEKKEQNNSQKQNNSPIKSEIIEEPKKEVKGSILDDL